MAIFVISTLGILVLFFSIIIFRYPSIAIWFILLILLIFSTNLGSPNYGYYSRSYFELFIRYGGLTPVEWLMIWITFLIFIRRIIKKEHLHLQIILDPALKWIFVIFTIGMIHGMIRRLVAPYGNTTLLAPFGAFAPVFYIFFMTVLIQNTITTPQELFLNIRIYWYFVYSVIVFGIILFILFLFGLFKPMLIKGIMPIILYEQLLLFFYPLAFSLISRRMKLPNIWSPSLYVISFIIIFILISTRRLEYILALAIPALTYIIGNFTKIFPRLNWKRQIKIIFLLLIIPVILFVILPLPGKNIFYETILSLGMGEKHGNLASAAERMGQLQNLFLNIKQENTYYFGFGLGTFWKEIVPVTHSLGSGFLPLIEKGYTSFPQFHLPIINFLFRFGYLGAFILFSVFFWYLLNIIKTVRVLPNSWSRAHYISLSSSVLLFLLIIGDTRYHTTTYIGIIMGFAETIKIITKKYANEFRNMPINEGRLF